MQVWALLPPSSMTLATKAASGPICEMEMISQNCERKMKQGMKTQNVHDDPAVGADAPVLAVGEASLLSRSLSSRRARDPLLAPLAAGAQ